MVHIQLLYIAATVSGHVLPLSSSPQPQTALDLRGGVSTSAGSCSRMTSPKTADSYSSQSRAFNPGRYDPFENPWISKVVFKAESRTPRIQTRNVESKLQLTNLSCYVLRSLHIMRFHIRILWQTSRESSTREFNPRKIWLSGCLGGETPGQYRTQCLMGEFV